MKIKTDGACSLCSLFDRGTRSAEAEHGASEGHYPPGEGTGNPARESGGVRNLMNRLTGAGEQEGRR